MKALSYTLGITALLIGSAAAQNPADHGNQPGQAQNQDASKSGAQNQKSGSQNQQSIARQVRGDLAKAGYTDVNVMPESFLVKAKDKEGHTVMMIINPDSFLSVTEISNRNGQSSTGTSGNNKANSPADSAHAVPGNNGK
jgi:hypothetical protein